MVYITRKEHFNSAHRLFRPEYSDEENLNIFGKCSNPSGMVILCSHGYR